VFTDSKKYVKSQILVANSPTQIEVFEGKLIDIAVNESKTRLSAKDKIPRKRKTQEKQVATFEEAIPIKQAL
jgi:5'(3')-deoxyribonucleotidase